MNILYNLSNYLLYLFFKKNIIFRKEGSIYYMNSSYQFHRKDGPAVEYLNGNKEWWLNGKCHREDGPAVEYLNGDKEWYLNGERHREDGPAIEYINGNKYWYKNGELHRENGPAVEHVNGYTEWWLKGKRYKPTEHVKKLYKAGNL